MASTVTEPSWVADRRAKAASLAAEQQLPSHKGIAGWEFTELKKDFSLDRFPPGVGGPLPSVQPAHVITPPEGATELLQVDGATGEGVKVEDGPVVLPLDVAVSEHPELVEPHLGTVVTLDEDSDLFVTTNEQAWTGGAFVWVPRGVKVEEPIPSLYADPELNEIYPYLDMQLKIMQQGNGKIVRPPAPGYTTLEGVYGLQLNQALSGGLSPEDALATTETLWTNILSGLRPGAFVLRIDPEQAAALGLGLDPSASVVVPPGGGFIGQVAAQVRLGAPSGLAAAPLASHWRPPAVRC